MMHIDGALCTRYALYWFIFTKTVSARPENMGFSVHLSMACILLIHLLTGQVLANCLFRTPNSQFPGI